MSIRISTYHTKILANVLHNINSGNTEFLFNSNITEDQQKYLVEAVINGAPLPTLYMRVDKNGNRMIIRGVNVFSSIIQFINSKEYLDLPPLRQSKLIHAPVLIHEINPGCTEEELKQILFMLNN